MYAGAVLGRLAVIGGLFALCVVVDVHGEAVYPDSVLRVLYGILFAALVSTVAHGLVVRPGSSRWLGLSEAGIDLCLITALVYCTGGAQSVFGFLYVCWVVYAAGRLGPVGALGTSGLSTIAYAGVSIGLAQGWIQSLDPTASVSPYVAVESVGRHALAFLTTGLLCYRLAREIRTGRTRLRELGEIYRMIVGNVSSGLLTVDRDERITSFNREAERITSWRESEAIGMPLAAVLPGLRPSELTVGERMEEAERAGGPASRHSARLIGRDRRELYLGFSVSPLRGDGDELEGFVFVFQDLTGVVEMEERLRRSERLAAVGQLAAGLAHEIRNPLASLLGAVELLEQELKPQGQPSRRLFGIVERETRRLSRLLSEFLAFARPSKPRTTTVPLRSLLEEVRELLATAEQTQVDIDLEVPADVQATGDPDQLRQVFWNLLLNAVQAEPAGGPVTVRACRGAETSELEFEPVEISVKDHGPGIPPESLSQVFDPFFTTKPKGTGLGLATVHRVVEAHGGSVQISSEPGEGTCVRVLLPAAE